MKDINKVAIAGAGGIGGFVTEFLCDYGVARNQFPLTGWQVDLYDDDRIDIKNLLHQNFTDADLGKKKSKVFEERSAGLITAVDRFMNKGDFAQYDVILCCVDSSSFRRDLYNFWLDKDNRGNLKYFIDGRCSSRNIVLMNGDTSDETLKKNIIEQDIVGSCLLDFEKENNISHVTPRIIAGMVVQNFLNWLRGEKTNERVTRI